MKKVDLKTSLSLSKEVVVVGCISSSQDGVVVDRGGQCIDLYNQKVYDDIFVTIITKVNQCNHYWVTQAVENE